MLQTILTKVFGTKSDRDTKALIPIVDEINSIYDTLQTKSDDDLINRTREFKLEIASAREVAQKYAKEKISDNEEADKHIINVCLLYTSPSPRDGLLSRMPSSA